MKFEWQRKYCAPRESYCKNSSEIIDQPFAIEVRNVRCMRCKQWGHLNTDRVCPLFGQSFTKEPTTSDMIGLDQVKKNLQKEGLTLKRGTDLDRFTSVFSKAKSALTSVSKQTSEEEDSLAMEFLKNLTERQREKLLKKLSKLSDKSPKQNHKSKHKHSRRH